MWKQDSLEFHGYLYAKLGRTEKLVCLGIFRTCAAWAGRRCGSHGFQLPAMPPNQGENSAAAPRGICYSSRTVPWVLIIHQGRHIQGLVWGPCLLPPFLLQSLSWSGEFTHNGREIFTGRKNWESREEEAQGRCQAEDRMPSVCVSLSHINI